MNSHMIKITSRKEKNENCVQLQKCFAARAKTDACKDNKNQKSRLLILIAFIIMRRIL